MGTPGSAGCAASVDAVEKDILPVFSVWTKLWSDLLQSDGKCRSIQLKAGA
jgi:hypothetical protein